jgi:predicted amidohydrolase
VSPVSKIHYVECDVPPGVTLAEWRRDRIAQTRRPPSWLRTRRRAAVRALRRAWGVD